MAAELYHRLGGQDERFRGWGWEDREFWRRLKRATDVQRFSDTLLHLDHPRPPMQDDAALANQRLFESLSRDGATAVPAWIGDAHRYARELTHVPQAAATLHATSKVELGRRACERWWTWHPTRIDQIVRRRNAPASVLLSPAGGRCRR